MVQFLLPKLLYICLYGVLGSAIPYLSLFYSDNLHLPSQQIGIILAIAPFIQSVACPFWTLQVDKRPHWHGKLMAILMFIGGLSVIALMFIPMVLPQDKTSTTLIVTVVLAVTFAFFGQPVTVLVDSAVLKILGDHKIYYGKHIYTNIKNTSLLIYYIIGDQRLWGSISNGVCILVVGYFIGLFGINWAFYIFGTSVVGFILIALGTKVADNGGTGDDEREPLLTNTVTKGNYNYPPTADMESMLRVNSISSHANTLLIENDQDLLNLQRTNTSSVARDLHEETDLILDQMDSLPPLGLALSHIPTVDTSLAAFANIGYTDEEDRDNLKNIIFASPKVWTFLLMTLFFGIFYSMVAQFLFLFLKQDLKLESSVIGWTGPIGGITEVSTFYVSRLLLKNFSVSSLVTVAHVAIILRNLAYKQLVAGQPGTMICALMLQLVNGKN